MPPISMWDIQRCLVHIGVWFGSVGRFWLFLTWLNRLSKNVNITLGIKIFNVNSNSSEFFFHFNAVCDKGKRFAVNSRKFYKNAETRSHLINRRFVIYLTVMPASSFGLALFGLPVLYLTIGNFEPGTWFVPYKVT